MHHTGSVPELPQLSPGVRLLDAPRRSIGPLHALVLDHLLVTGGTAVWIDAHGHATTTYLAEVAPSPRVLDRVRVARGFTPYQHQSLLQDAAAEIDGDTSLVVAPAVDGLYRDEDVRGAEPQSMLLRSVARLARYAREAEIPVLTTRAAADEFSAPVSQVADSTITVERTRFGPRFRSPNFETQIYAESGPTMQTTLTYWARILRARRPAHETQPSQERAIAEVSP
ncbi:P-loop NTPase family protein [Halodesulfurarchaeum formicicum]|uniref:hypothetical protein n=1 Tax=Halodesulfurarchaeum formicicum TaxID=1873524 RepID=UPI000903C930|nr:hypothetical protein [Halodesulfurarchaeum formicicum]